QTLAATPLVRGAAPTWESLGMHPQTDYRQALEKELGGDYLPVSADHLRVLAAGCRSGQRALRLARFFEGVEVAAIDPNLDNIVQTNRAAERYEISNLSHGCLSLRELDELEPIFDVVECGPGLAPVTQIAQTMRRLAGLLN